MDAATDSSVIRGAPPGNRPGEARDGGLAKCREDRVGKPHVWEIHRRADGAPSGKMICLWCGKKTLMKRSFAMTAPVAHCQKTGY